MTNNEHLTHHSVYETERSPTRLLTRCWIIFCRIVFSGYFRVKRHMKKRIHCQIEIGTTNQFLRKIYIKNREKRFLDVGFRVTIVYNG
jgi:hypothetical protein